MPTARPQPGPDEPPLAGDGDVSDMPPGEVWIDRGWRGALWRLRTGVGYAASAVRHAPAVARMLAASRQGALGRLLRARPEVWTALHAPFVAAGWDARTRLARIANHCAIVERLGPPFDLHPDEFADLLHLGEIGPDYRLTIDQPRWMLRDGLLALSLWKGADRLFSLSFLFASEGRRLLAIVGGIQGRRSPDARDAYRALTREACGVRPRDLLIELFRIMCDELGVSAIHAVSDATRHQRSRYFRHAPGFVDPVTVDYDGIWRERGGTVRADGLYELAVRRPHRPAEEVPARKRTLYRRRQAMMDGIRARMAPVLMIPDPAAVRPHGREWLTRGYRNE